MNDTVLRVCAWLCARIRMLFAHGPEALSQIAPLSLVLCMVMAATAPAEERQLDPEAVDSAQSFNSFMDLIMSPFHAIDQASGISSMEYRVKPVSGRILFNSNRTGIPTVFLARDGSVRELCRNAHDARWSPDGRKIICRPTANKVTWDMAILDEGGRLIRIVRPFENASVSQALFRPDNPEIILFKGRKTLYSKEELYSMDLKTDKVERITERPIYAFDVSPDGKTIAFTAPRDDSEPKSQPCIWAMDSDGGNPRKLTDTDGDATPAWSPDGSSIVFTSTGKRSSFRQVYTMDVAGRNVRQVTAGPSHKAKPCWSPDSRKLCYESFIHGSTFDESELMVINIDGTGEARFMDAYKTDLNHWATDSSPQWAAE